MYLNAPMSTDKTLWCTTVNISAPLHAVLQILQEAEPAAEVTSRFKPHILSLNKNNPGGFLLSTSGTPDLFTTSEVLQARV